MPSHNPANNAIKHGLLAGTLPPGCGYVGKAVNKLRAALEQAAIDAGVTIGVVEAGLIVSACRWERHGLLCQRWLRKEAATLSATERLNFSREIARASTERDRCLKALGLSASTATDIFADLYRQPLPQAAIEHDGGQQVESPSDASNASVVKDSTQAESMNGLSHA